MVAGIFGGGYRLKAVAGLTGHGGAVEGSGGVAWLVVVVVVKPLTAVVLRFPGRMVVVGDDN
ncbi:hypothetical protein CASFOL_000880 [Castilleja foliolosa]|uniref:Uncharacterized protein n=1 Tax=Castilleja foliolosa TaxID=1961234 RepID=A0ABD3ELK1_9LAMI